MDIKYKKVEFEKRVAFLIDNGKYDACKDAIECFIINFWREELSNEQNLRKFNNWCVEQFSDWCVEQFKEFDDEE